MRNSARSNPLPFAVAALLTFAVGCNRDGVKVYKVDASDAVVTTPPPVTASSPAAMPSSMPSSMPDGLPVPDNSGLPRLKYNLPDGWQEKPPTQLRVASFAVSENNQTADVSVIPLNGTAGGDPANVNRWRGQVGQPPLDESSLKSSAEPVQVGSQPADLYDIAGTSPGSGVAERILGVILHTDQSAWYFKMMGDAALVEKNKPAFIAFLKSVAFQPAAAPAAMDAGQLPPAHPALPDALNGPSAPATDKPAWTVPPDWKAGELAQFLVARYVIQGPGDAAAAVNVSQLDGNGGGLLPNLNRWRKQLGQPPLTDGDAASLPTIPASGGQAVIADFTGADARTGKPARLIGLVLPLNGQTWFYKLMGDPDLVGRQKDALISFVQSAQYPAPK